MKLYMHPVSTTSRPIRLFIAESGIEVDEQIVDLLTGEHLGPAFAAINPNKMVPVLVDGDLRLTESSAILKYLADTIDSPAYPQDLKQRAKVNEAMDWFNANFSRDFGYGLCYPQLFPHHKRQSDAVQTATLEWARTRAQNWLQILNDDLIGPERRYLVGNTLTIADYFGVCMLTLGEITRCDWSKYPNIKRWVDTMKQLPHWNRINEALYGYASQVKDLDFVTV